MKKATRTIYLDELRPKRNGKCSVKIRVTYNRQRKYYSTGVELTPDEYNKIMFGKRRTKEQSECYTELSTFETKAQEAIDSLPIFTFDNFEKGYSEFRDITNSVSFAFDECIEQLKSEARIGTAISYQCAKNSFDNYKKDLTFAEISNTFLKSYEKWMLENGKSKTTVGIYVRSLRAIYNLQSINKSIYPFGEGAGKYKIPTGRNTKKALAFDEIGLIYNYEAPDDSTMQMAKDYWLFLYLSNGMNVKDFCLLKWKNIEGDILTYERAKTQRSNKETKRIQVALKPETWAIIKKWGNPSLSKEAFIFPYLKTGMTPTQERATYQQLTKIINKYMKRISIELGLNKNVTTYFARHSFATILKRSGAKTEMISELLGHSNVGITENYLDSFEKEQIQEQTDVLTSPFKKAN